MNDSKETLQNSHEIEQDNLKNEHSDENDDVSIDEVNQPEDTTDNNGLDECKSDEEDAAQLYDRLLRALADMENLRQRTKREIQDVRAYAMTDFARDMLSVSDNLQRAMQSISDQGCEKIDLDTVCEGIKVTDQELTSILGKYEIRSIESLNERFNPNFHQALFEVEQTDVAAGTVVQVVQVGYVIGERVLRPAMVGVSKGGPIPLSTKINQENATEKDNEIKN